MRLIDSGKVEAPETKFGFTILQNKIYPFTACVRLEFDSRVEKSP